MLSRPILVCSCIAIAAASANASPESNKAEALIREGLDLRRHNRDERALPLFQEAYQVSRTPRSAGQLGFCEMAVGYWLDAEQHLSEALKFDNHPWVAKNLQVLRDALATVRTNIAEITIAGTPVGAEVWIAGKEVGRLPLPTPVRLTRGEVDIQVRASGYLTATKSLSILSVAPQRVTIELEKVVAPAMPEAERHPVREEKVASPEPTRPVLGPVAGPSGGSLYGEGPGRTWTRRTWAWTAAVAAGAVLLGGGIETAIWLHKKDQFDNHTGALPSNPAKIGKNCGADDVDYGGEGCLELQNDLARARRYALVGLGIGGALGIASAVLFATDAPARPSTEHALSCEPDLLRRGVTCHVAF